jgi:hypothetical protein
VINLLEALYVLTVISFLAALVQMIRGRRAPARRLAIVGGVAAALSVVLYWYLSASS